MEALTSVPSAETIEDYTNILKSVDWMTGLKAAAILLLGLAAVRLLLHFLRGMLKKSNVPATVHSILVTLLRILLNLVVILAALNAIGIPVTSFIALLSLAGLAISLALQGVLGNLASGLIVLGSRPFDVGDVIEHDGLTGSVREIRMMHTVLDTFDGRLAYIPNSSISGGRVINITQTGRRRVDISISASYNQTPEQVRKAIGEAVSRTEGILEDPAPMVFLDSYGDSSIHYVIRVWTASENFLSVKNNLTELLYTTFAENRVEMTYPHINVHHVS
ncbi:MAG: mechanosensitive ion channel family protein [Clostridia bacterium]|nr:mechanosensitive ion channel family protein [Clostridia bacterium]